MLCGREWERDRGREGGDREREKIDIYYNVEGFRREREGGETESKGRRKGCN